MAATPPLLTAVHTPSTPLHGAKYDDYRPRQTRKSTRESSARTIRAIETPPPHSDKLTKHSLDSQNSSSLRSAAHTYSPPSSTPNSPRKKVTKGERLMEGEDINTMDGRASDASYLDPTKNQSLQQPSLNPAGSMLPTPAKTPRKKPVQQAAVNAAARVLFPARPGTVEDAMPTPRKRRNKRHVGFSLYSSMEDEGDDSENKIEIYTDSKDKVPELDTSADNPFYEQPDQDGPVPEPSKSKTGRKRKASRGVEDDAEIKEAFHRGEGMVYVFRGKKIFRKFPKEDSETNSVNGSNAELPNSGRLTRSSIKPRLLFPTARQQQEREAANVEDEEAPTDIEEPVDHVMTDPEEAEVTTPIESTMFSPTTPPTTGHATRASTKKATLDRSPIESPEPTNAMPHGPKTKKISPFGGWARTKGGMGGGGKGKKRAADVMENEEHAGGSKKAKGNEVV